MATLTVDQTFQVTRHGVTYEFELAEEGGYVVWVPAYPSCVSQGETFEEALASIEDALQGCLATAQDLGLDIPEELRHLRPRSPRDGP